MWTKWKTSHKKILRIIVAIGLIFIYFVTSVALYGMNWKLVFNYPQLISVSLGIVLLTMTQVQKGITKSQILFKAKHNALLAGAITSLFALMAALNKPTLGNVLVSQALLPLLYGSLWYVLLNMNWSSRESIDKVVPLGAETNRDSENSAVTRVDLSPETVYFVLTQKHFTPREIHVAMRILTNSHNKVIADDLFITEATVKKHIQNMFKKCDALDRQDFLRLYLEWLETIK